MGNRRGTRHNKPRASLAAGHNKVLSGSTYLTDPSGVSIGHGGLSTAGGIGLNMTSGITCSKIDTGQGTQYKIFRGITTLNEISVGTQVITTGLTSCSTFVGSIGPYPFTSSTSMHITHAILRISGGGVSCGFWYTKAGAVSVAKGTSGISLYWIAMGT